MKIIGMWLAAKTHRSGIAVVEKLAFLPDGTGTYAVHHWSLQHYDEFTWELLDENRIRIAGGERFFPDPDGHGVLRTDSRFDFSDVPFTIASHLPGEERVDILHVDLGPDYSNTFFLSKDPIETHTPPEFKPPD